MDKNELRPRDYIRSILTIVVFLLIFLMATPFILLALLFSMGKLTNFIIANIAPLMMKPVLAAAGLHFTIKRHGKSHPDRPVIYIVNHSSTIDLITILALGLPRVRFVAKWQLQYNPLFFLLGRLTGQVFIRRQQSQQAVQKLQNAYVRIKKHQLSVLLAPEGSRKHEGVIGPFKKGPFRMAMALNYPMVPIYFEGNRELSAGGSLLGKSGSITAHIYPPVDTSTWNIVTLEDHIREVRHHYLSLAGVRHDPVQTEIKNEKSVKSSE